MLCSYLNRLKTCSERGRCDEVPREKREKRAREREKTCSERGRCDEVPREKREK